MIYLTFEKFTLLFVHVRIIEHMEKRLSAVIECQCCRDHCLVFYNSANKIIHLSGRVV